MSHSLVVSSMTDEDETAITAESELFCKASMVRIQKTGQQLVKYFHRKNLGEKTINSVKTVIIILANGVDNMITIRLLK
jgi:hypothetical protein